MTPTTLRRFAKRYGTVGLFLVGVILVARHVWFKRRSVHPAIVAILLAGAYALNLYDRRTVVHGAHELYTASTNADVHNYPQPIEERIIGNRREGSTTERIRALAHEFARSIELQHHVRAVDAGNQLCDLFNPTDGIDRDGQWLSHAKIGWIYLEQGWLDEAENQFQSVLSAVPPGEPGWGSSPARSLSTYGLARSSSLRGSYGEALQWLARAPGEYNLGCGNAIEAEAAELYPMKVVWTTANLPLPEAAVKLEDIMRGRFAPMQSALAADTSEEQRQHAALEAGLTLGCLYDNAGMRTDAAACWDLVASNATSLPEDAAIARAMLDRLRRE